MALWADFERLRVCTVIICIHSKYPEEALRGISIQVEFLCPDHLGFDELLLSNETERICDVSRIAYNNECKQLMYLTG